MARIPAPMQVRTLLEELLDRGVEVAPGPPWAPMGSDLGTFALYVDDSLVVRSMAVCDLPFSAYAGAAIGLIPIGGAEQAIEDKQVPESIAENLYEVLNICAALQNVDGAPHMRLYSVTHIGSPVAPEVQALAGVLGQRLDLDRQDRRLRRGTSVLRRSRLNQNNVVAPGRA